MTFTKATKTKSKLRLAITGTAGSGKTYGTLLIAQGLGGNIAMIDTENGSGNVYSDLCDYDICNLSAPYDPRKYIECIHEAEKAGYDILIIDSLSHAWSGEGGVLDLHGRVAANSKSGNTYIAWSQVTPLQNRLVDTILASPCHIIATMRSKTEYLQSKDERGKTEVVKVGLAPVQRDGIEYEFSTVFDISASHLASVNKDRTALFGDTPFTISPDIGARLRKWLNDDGNEKKEGAA